jgi:hypothetical protein
MGNESNEDKPSHQVSRGKFGTYTNASRQALAAFALVPFSRE